MLKTIIFITIAILLVGCGSRIDSMARTIDYAIFGEDDVELTAEEIEELAYPYQYLTIGEQPRIAVALGFDDDGIYKWLSGNQEILTTYNGRVINTQGLGNGLTHVTNLGSDPLSCILNQAEDCQLSWTASAQFGRSHAANVQQVKTTFQHQGSKQLLLASGQTVQVEHWQEAMVSDSKRWTNDFWISTENRRVVKSEQKWSVEQPFYRLEELKAYGKELTDSGANNE